MSATTEKKHVPGDVNHQMLGHAGYEFCPACGSSLRGKITALESEMLKVLEELFSRFEARSERDYEALGKAETVIRKARGL